MSKVFLVALLVFISPFSFGSYEEYDRSDATINRAIQELLAYKKQKEPSQNIVATTQSGQVILYGQTGSEKSRMETVQLVASIPGVISVLNRIQVKPPLDENWPLVERHRK